MSAFATAKRFEFFSPIFGNSHAALDWLQYNVAQRVKILLLNKNENTDAVFSICIKHDSKARNRNLGFTSTKFLPVLAHF